MTPLLRQSLRWVAMALVWAAALYLLNKTLLSRIDWGAVTTHAYTAGEMRGVMAFAACFLVAMALRALRFHLLMNALRPLALRDCVTIHLWGFAIGAITPMRVGEGVRLFWARRREIPVAQAVMVWVVERASDLAMLLAITGAATALVLLRRVMPDTLATGPVLALGAGLAVLTAAGLLLAKPGLALAQRCAARLPAPVASQIASLGQGGRKLVEARVMAPFALLTLLVWAAMASAFFLGYSAFFGGLGPGGALLLLGLVNLSFLVAFLPGHVLGYHAVAAAVLTGFGAGPEQAAISSVVIHAVTISIVLLLGGIARLVRLVLRLDQV
ncbi:MAG: lysylphosphatidylglycerol synthase transmembrane domain-containing protein [Pseudomonadota bacterium]|nr:lysylphosphatidylglycerol synthase transmembrane domain-containing protein [Pseudomonadota bacterium]